MVHSSRNEIILSLDKYHEHNCTIAPHGYHLVACHVIVNHVILYHVVTCHMVESRDRVSHGHMSLAHLKRLSSVHISTHSLSPECPSSSFLTRFSSTGFRCRLKAYRWNSWASRLMPQTSSSDVTENT